MFSILFSSILFLVGFIWLIVTAFGRGIGWGLAVLFLSPFGAVAFAFSFWEEVKKPVIAYFAALIFYVYTAGSFIYSTFMNSHVMEASSEVKMLVEQSQKGEISKEEMQQRMVEILKEAQNRVNDMARQQQPEEQHEDNYTFDTDEYTQAASIDDIGSREKPAVRNYSDEKPDVESIHAKLNNPQKTPQKNTPVAYTKLRHYVGEAITVNLKDGRKHTGVVNKIMKQKIEMYREFSSGRFSFWVQRNNIKSIYLVNRKK